MAMTYSDVLPSLKKHILVDGFHLALDPEKSHGSYLFNGIDQKEYLDFFSFFASLPLGFNHPKLNNDAFKSKIAPFALIKPSNSDVYSVAMAEFVDQFHNVCIPDAYPYSFYIEGGALAVENALKIAFDWKVRKNIAAGHGERGQMALHFKEAFHGRSGYTMSLTNTSSVAKTQYFPKFAWPRVTNPKMFFPIHDPKNLERTEALEQLSKKEITEAFDQYPNDIACIVVEPIQGEGGDNHFRPEFLAWLRQIADEREALLVFDEIQTGFGGMGSWWAFEQLGVEPDVVCFGKKTQVCGVFANRRIDDVDNCFKVSSRINSTFGGGLVDMVRASQFINIIEEDNLLAHAKGISSELTQHLNSLAESYDGITNIRGRGTWFAFDLPDEGKRDSFYNTLLQSHQMIALKCGDRSIRMRTSLNLPHELVGEGMNRIEATLKELF